MQPPEIWGENIQHSGLSRIAAYYLWRGLAPSTRRNYESPRSRFGLFCKLSNYCHHHGGCFPAKVTWLIEWLCSLAGTVKVKSMKLYLSGLKSYHLDLGIEYMAFSDPRLERTIQGIKRDHNESERRVRTPLTRPALLRILSHLSPANYDHIVLHSAFALAFARFLRVGQFTYREADTNLGVSYSKWYLTKESIRMADDESYMELTLPASKTDSFRKGKTLTIAASSDIACPVQAMKRLQATDHHRSPASPLFCLGRHQQQALTREHVVKSLQDVAITAGLENGAWNGYSFRRGAATWAAKMGIPEGDIQLLGRWRSDAYKVYIEYSRNKRISLSKRFQHGLHRGRP